MPRKTRRKKRGAIGLPDSLLNRHRAEMLATEIQADIAREQFDPTLAKYKPQPEPEPESPRLTTADLFEQFIEHRREDGTSGQTITASYKPCGNTPETTARHYAHMIDRPEMPGF
jgi:integrase